MTRLGARRDSGRMRTRLAWAVLVGLLAVLPVPHPRVDAVSAPLTRAEETCRPVLFLGVRGSGQKQQDSEGYGKQVGVVATRFREQVGAANLEDTSIDYASLGVEVLWPGRAGLAALLSMVPAVQAVALADFRRHHYGPYMASIGEGVDRLEGSLSRRAISCPDQQIVLAGYSQGAMVVHRTLTRLQDRAPGILRRVAGVALVADGDRVRRTAGRVWGDRRAASKQGIGVGVRFARSARDVPATVASHTINLCDADDVVCDFALTNIRVGRAIHVGYRGPALERVADQLAEWVDTPFEAFEGDWYGHTRRVTVSPAGMVKVVIYSGCCSPVAEATYQLADPRPDGDSWLATATVTSVTVWPDYQDDDDPLVGDVGTVEVTDGVWRDPFFGYLFCGDEAPAGWCGA